MRLDASFIKCNAKLITQYYFVSELSKMTLCAIAIRGKSSALHFCTAHPLHTCLQYRAVVFLDGECPVRSVYAYLSDGPERFRTCIILRLRVVVMISNHVHLGA